jgi:hypothetical protein
VGYHFVDETASFAVLPDRDVSGDNVGVNVQFGFDVRLSETVGLFGVGRTDLVQTSDEQDQARAQLGLGSEDNQTKVYLGVRLHL